MSHSPENFRRGILYCRSSFGYRKERDKKGGGEYQDFPSKHFCLTVRKIYVVESFTNAFISGSEKVWKEGGEYQGFAPNLFLSHIAEKFRGGILYCCIIFGHPKGLDKREGREFQDSPSKIFRLTVPKVSVGKSFTVALIFLYRKSLDKRGGGVSSFSVENF